MWTSNRNDRKLENTVKQSLLKHLGELHKEWTEAGISASRVTMLGHLREKGYQATAHFWNRKIIRRILPGLRRKITGLLLSGPKSSFQMKVNFAFDLEIKVPESGGRVERHRIHVAWSPVWSFHSQWWFGLPYHLLVLVHYAFWSPHSTHYAAIYQDILEHFMLPPVDKLYGDADFISGIMPIQFIQASCPFISFRHHAHSKWGCTCRFLSQVDFECSFQKKFE